MTKNFHASLVAFLQRVAVQAAADGLAPDLQVVDLDDHNDVQELPATDLLGLMGFTTSVDGKIHTVDCGFAVMPLDDQGGFKRRDLVDRLYILLQPERQVDLLDALTGARLGYLVAIDGTQAAPTARPRGRALQAVHASFKVDPHATSRAR